MKVLWSPGAREDRAAIWEYIAADNPSAAVVVDEAFSHAVSEIATHPQLGRPGMIPGTRELFPVKQYRLVYETTKDKIWVLAIVHTSQRWPAS